MSGDADAADPQPSPTALASSVSHRVNLVDLRTSRILSELRRLPTRRPLMFDVDHGVTCEHADNVLAYTVQVSMTVEEPEADGGDATDSNAGEGGVGPVFTADLTLVAVYELSEGEEPGEEALGAFGDLSVRHTVYPYLRELIHTLTMRAGLPPLVLESFLAPVMRDAQR